MIAWICASVLVVLLGVSLARRTWFFGAVGVLGMAGVLLSLSQQPPSAGAWGGKRRQVSWMPRASKPGTQGTPTPQARPEAVSTPAEAAQAIQQFRVAQAMLRQGDEDEAPAALAVPSADVRPLPATLAPQPVPPVPGLPSQAARTSEAHDAAGQAAVPIGRALKSCDALKAEIQAKLEAKSLTGSTLTIMTRGDLLGLPVVGRCEGNTKTIVLNRARNAP
jgi:hypothetical protein